MSYNYYETSYLRYVQGGTPGNISHVKSTVKNYYETSYLRYVQGGTPGNISHVKSTYEHEVIASGSREITYLSKPRRAASITPSQKSAASLLSHLPPDHLPLILEKSDGSHGTDVDRKAVVKKRKETCTGVTYTNHREERRYHQPGLGPAEL
ncbi:hypothetical protein QE152_g25783 [Popillia japonica]|uniref:Uncharacterized protein n=1 Tax=Popillia japonica TaxID=7064 RepID=A0AAW1K032_POPJA